MKYKLTICYLYPDLMDTYGDRGNIITLQMRCKWRGIETTLVTNTIGDSPSTIIDSDLIFFGGGQDQAQEIVGKDIQKKATALKKTVDDGVVLLSICGGYQLLQNYFKTKDNQNIPGVGIFNAYTEASDTRMMNNLQIELNPKLASDIQKPWTSNNLIGFENHSGKTYLEKGTEPLGKVILGSGNNGEDKTEGAFYKNAFGCYLHGSLLPKNPHFADFLIARALGRHFPNFKLKILDDSQEWQTHNELVSKVRSTG